MTSLMTSRILGFMEDLSAAMGRGLRVLRDKHGLLQEDIAAGARDAGLAWTAATVAAIETGKRRLTAEELLLLRLVVYYATGGEVIDVLDLVPADAVIELTPQAPIDGAGLHQLARGDLALAAQAHRAGRDTVTQRFIRFGDPYVLRQAWPDASGRELDRACDDSVGEAEADAARRLDVAPVLLSIAAYRLWGHSLTAERDRRARERARPGATPRSMQAVRGNVTRLLVDELAPLVAEISATVDTWPGEVRRGEARHGRRGLGTAA